MKLILALCALILVSSAGAAGSSRPLVAPTGLHAFAYRADEPVKADHTYAQMPAFAWAPVRGAKHYELQLATNKTFSDAEMLYDKGDVAAPVTSVDLQVPWMTGDPYALWVRVRAYSGARVSPWSAAFGFNTAWQQLPEQRSAPRGLIRWSPVEGATAYEVWFTNIGIRIRTLTTVADEREYWTFHPGFAGVVKWRVRAIRFVRSAALPDRIQVTSYGPYTQTFTSTNSSTAISKSALHGTDAISDVDSTPTQPAPNALMPGFAWNGSTGIYGESGTELWRVYVYSDRQCVNSVTVGSVVGGPAWAPRNAPPDVLPSSTAQLAQVAAGKFLGFGAEGAAFMADGTKIVTSEEAVGAQGSAGSSTSSSSTSGLFGGAGTDPGAETNAGSISLPDNGWPAGRYWWTVVPVAAIDVVSTSSSSSGSSQSTDALEYHDLELPQDACAQGRVWPFGMQSMPVVTNDQTPLVSGWDGTRVTSAVTRRPAFVFLPVITWTSAFGAQAYEIQLSRHLYPWVPRIRLYSEVTSANLPLAKTDVGTWYYRVRGINPSLPGSARKMTWSAPASILITGDHYRIVK